jgi:hypothetical protein
MMMKASAIAMLVSLCVLSSLGAQLPPGAPDLGVEELATGPYSRMHMLYERTIFGVDVLTVEIRFDGPTAERLQRLASGQPYGERLAGQVVEAALEAEAVFVTLEFERDVALGRWVEGAREGLERGWTAGLIEEATYRHVHDNLPRWFDVVASRGFRAADRILYRGYADRLRTVLLSSDADVLLDQTDQGASHRRALLAGYLAPGTDFRLPLIRSLLE